jgi:8-oxo-dGTP pyrophosphatase MutT (NUDIX family)
VTSRFQVVPAAYIVLRRNEGAGQVLLQLRSGTGYRDGHWACAAAGHVEAGESVVEAAVREAREEIGVRIEPSDLAPVCAMHRTHGNGNPRDERVDFFFTCTRFEGTPRRLEQHKSADLRWFDLGALPDPVVPHERRVLDLLRAGDVPAILTEGFG